MASPSLAPLRILYIMPSGTVAEVDGALFALSRMLRDRGESFMGLTLRPPLPTTEIPLLDTYGMRWSYLPLPGWPIGAQRASWRALVQRFRPDIVQFAAYIDAKVIQQVQRMFPRQLHPTFIIESNGSHPKCLLPNTFVWPDLQEAISVDAKVRSAQHLNGHAVARISMVSVTDPHDHQAIVAQCEEIERLLLLFPSLRCTVLCPRPLSTQELSQLSHRALEAVRFVQTEIDWLMAASKATGAIGIGGHSISPRLVGATLALTLAVYLRDAPGLSVLAQLSEIKHGEAYIPSITSRIAEWSNINLSLNEETDRLDSLWQMYHGAKLWMEAAPFGKM